MKTLELKEAIKNVMGNKVVENLEAFDDKEKSRLGDLYDALEDVISYTSDSLKTAIKDIKKAEKSASFVPNFFKNETEQKLKLLDHNLDQCHKVLGDLTKIRKEISKYI